MLNSSAVKIACDRYCVNPHLLMNDVILSQVVHYIKLQIISKKYLMKTIAESKKKDMNVLDLK